MVKKKINKEFSLIKCVHDRKWMVNFMWKKSEIEEESEGYVLYIYIYIYIYINIYILILFHFIIHFFSCIQKHSFITFSNDETGTINILLLIIIIIIDKKKQANNKSINWWYLSLV